jgi:hypothetical protein
MMQINPKHTLRSGGGRGGSRPARVSVRLRLLILMGATTFAFAVGVFHHGRVLSRAVAHATGSRATPAPQKPLPPGFKLELMHLLKNFVMLAKRHKLE